MAAQVKFICIAFRDRSHKVLFTRTYKNKYPGRTSVTITEDMLKKKKKSLNSPVSAVVRTLGDTRGLKFALGSTESRDYKDSRRSFQSFDATT